MKPTKFQHANGALGGGTAERFGTEEDVADLPVFKSGAEIISCWQPSEDELLAIERTGRVWLRVAASRTHPPIEVSGLDPWHTGSPGEDIAATPDQPLSLEQVQERQRAKAQAIVKDLKRHRRAGEAEIVFVFDTGEGGSMSYVSTADREDCMTALLEWMFRQDRDRIATAISRYADQEKSGPEWTN